MEGVMDLSVAARSGDRLAAHSDEGRPAGSPTMWRCDLPGASLSLENASLWRDFHHLGTEMIITKTGRRMFPSLQFRVAGLDPLESYVVLLDLVPASAHRYRYSGSAWSEAGGSEQHLAPAPRCYVHPDSPAKGARWMSELVSLHKAKITNNPANESGHIMLMSMHKYLPRVMIARTADVHLALWSPMCVVSFPETEFIAVTAYQSKKITSLKINTNPFARGFREGGQSNSKRKSDQKDDSTAAAEETGQSRRRQCSEPSSEHSAEDSGCVSAGSCSPAPDDCRLVATSQSEASPGNPRLHYLPYTYPPHDLWRFSYCQVPPPLLLHGPWGACPLLPPTFLGIPPWSDPVLNSALHDRGYASPGS